MGAVVQAAPPGPLLFTPRGASAAERHESVRALAGRGVTILGRVGTRLLVVDPEGGATLSDLGAVDALRPEDKLAPVALGAGVFHASDAFGASDALDAFDALAVHAAPGWSTRDLGRDLLSVGALSRARLEVLPRFVVVEGAAGRDVVRAIAARASVLAIVPMRSAMQPANDEARGLLQSGLAAAEPLHASGVGGQGEIVAVCDSGLSPGCRFDDASQSWATELVDPAAPPPIPLTSPDHRKVQAYQHHSASNATDEIDTGVLPWHGSAVAGIVAGDDGAWAEPQLLHPDAPPAAIHAGGWDGQAPGARLVVQDVHASGPSYLVPFDLAGFIESAWRAGARTWNASWGSPTAPGSYDHYARELDVAATRHPDLVIIASAGNSGPGAGSVVTPSTVRNGLSVGASGTGIWIEDVIPTSSHGPADDGRLKPDLVAPGSGIDTADGGQACGTRRGTGTSFAAPAVAAAAALVRQYLREGREAGGFPLAAPARIPSSALVRALLAASARSLLGGPQTTVVEQPAPSPEQGWGRVVLGDALPPRGSLASLVILSDDDVDSPADGFATAATTPATFTFQVLASGLPLAIAVSFTDALASPLATSPVVNDLDLEVESPAGDVYLGGVFAGGWSATGGSPNALDNIEIVRLPAPVAAGTWIVRVRPASILLGPQAFALAAVGRICRPAGAFTAPPLAVETACGIVSISAPSIGGTPPVTYAIFVGNTPGGEDFGNPLATGLSRAAAVDRAAAGTRYYVVEATDACGVAVRSAEASATISSPCDVADPLLLVTKTATDAVLAWNDAVNMREVVRFPVVSAVRAAPAIATTTAGTYSEPMPGDALTFYVIR